MLVGGFDGETVYGRRFENDENILDATISLEEAAAADVEIVFYYRRFQFTSQNPIAFEIIRGLQFHRITADWSYFVQWFYNKKSLATVERFDLLRLMIDRTIERPDIVFHPVYLAGDQSRRAIFHPGFARTTAYYKLLLNSLVADGLVEKVNNEYKITPQAFGALSEYEDEKRRHTSANRLQFWVAFFGIVSAIGTLAQAWPIIKGWLS